MLLALYHDNPSSQSTFQIFREKNVLEGLKALDSRIQNKGLGDLDPARNTLIRIGMETDGSARVIKNSYGVFHLAWRAQEHPEWPDQVLRELEEIRARIADTHGVPLRYVIWAGMGGSAEDKSMYQTVGLLRRGPRLYVLDSTDPAKMKAVLADIEHRSRLPLEKVLPQVLVVGMAMGMTSYEPVVNLERLYRLYERHKIDSQPNFVYMTLTGSLLDQFAGPRGYRRVELQLDGGNTTAGRHSAPLTRGSLYPLGLAKNDLRLWIDAALLTREEIDAAWRLASFLHEQGKAGRDKIALLLPREWSGAALWTKQNFEESLGKSEDLGLKIIIGEKPKLANYVSPKLGRQDRVFLVLSVKGLTPPDSQKTSMLRRAGYPLATLAAPRGTLLSHYMQFIHYVVFGVAYLRGMNFVTQPSVELYKSITGRLHSDAVKAGGVENTREWQAMQNSSCQLKWRGGITLAWDRFALPVDTAGRDAPAVYAGILRKLFCPREAEYGELTFFGDTRYSAPGKRVKRILERAAELVFRSRLKVPVDVYEGPAMNHSYHEMIIGHGRCLSTVLISDASEQIPAAGHTADYHRAQFLATQMALAQRGRAVVSIRLRDLEPATLAVLDRFFAETAKSLKNGQA